MSIAGPPARRGGPAHHPGPLAGGRGEATTRNPWAGNWTLAEQELTAVGELQKVGLAPKNRMLELRTRGGSRCTARWDSCRPTLRGSARQAVELRGREAAAAPGVAGRCHARTARCPVAHQRRAAAPGGRSRFAAGGWRSARRSRGEVVNLAIFTKGGVIEPGKPIMDIVPRAPTIVAEAQIRPEDVEHLRVGQAAQVMATGFSLRDASPIEGKVTVISADRVTDPRTRTQLFQGGDRAGGGPAGWRAAAPARARDAGAGDRADAGADGVRLPGGAAAAELPRGVAGDVKRRVAAIAGSAGPAWVVL